MGSCLIQGIWIECSQFDSRAWIAHNSRGVTPQIPFEIKIADEPAGAASDIRS